MLCCCTYADGVVASFVKQIQLEYYGGNISVYIEGIALEHISELPQTQINSSTEPCPQYALLHFFVRYWQTRC